MASLSGWRWTDELDTVDVISNVHLQGDRAAYLFFSSLLFFSSFLLFFSSSKVKERFIFAHELQLAERIHWECLKLEKRKREKGKGAPMYAPLVLHLHYCPPPTLPLPPRNIQITVCLVIQYNVRRISTKLQYTLGFRFFFPFFFFLGYTNSWDMICGSLFFLCCCVDFLVFSRYLDWLTIVSPAHITSSIGSLVQPAAGYTTHPSSIFQCVHSLHASSCIVNN